MLDEIVQKFLEIRKPNINLLFLIKTYLNADKFSKAKIL